MEKDDLAEKRAQERNQAAWAPEHSSLRTALQYPQNTSCRKSKEGAQPKGLYH